MKQINLPSPEELKRQIESCRVELHNLKKLLRASVALTRAEEARRSRQQSRSHSGGLAT